MREGFHGIFECEKSGIVAAVSSWFDKDHRPLNVGMFVHVDEVSGDGVPGYTGVLTDLVAGDQRILIDLFIDPVVLW